jgi:ArsR family transcriptional regulator
MAVPRITRDELKQKLDDPASTPVLLDVRLKYPYEHSTVRLPGALRIQPTAPDLSAVPRDREVVAYDSDPNEIVSSRVVAELIRRGYRASALKGGIAEWLAANLPTETKEAPKGAAPTPGSLK